jgi:hypothetical protein
MGLPYLFALLQYAALPALVCVLHHGDRRDPRSGALGRTGDHRDHQVPRVALHDTYQRTAATYTQPDIDEWFASGPIGELVLEVPPTLVAEALGYSPQVAFRHVDKAAEPWAGYAGRYIRSP